MIANIGIIFHFTPPIEDILTYWLNLYWGLAHFWTILENGWMLKEVLQKRVLQHLLNWNVE